MEILVSQLPSGGYGYDFPSINIKPMNFLEITNYIQEMPSDSLSKYMYDIKKVVEDDEKVMDCYAMDLDFLVFYKKLITLSEDLTYETTVKCPDCGKEITKTISLNGDIQFKQIDPKIMNGATVILGGSKYDISVPTVRDFLKVFAVYLRYKKIEDINIIKTLALFTQYDMRANEIEDKVLNAHHKDITLLMALRDLYCNRLEPIEIYCPDCNPTHSEEKGGYMTVSAESLTVDMFQLYKSSPIDGSEILFKQVL